MANQNTNVVQMPSHLQTRLPMSQSAVARGITPESWRVLVETTFPSAKTAEAIEMAFDYCKVRGLDIFKKPVHIVPMWNSTLRKETETIWVGINEIQITAHRTGQFAGIDSAKWGPLVTKTFSGEKKVYGKPEKVSVELTYPEWCEVVVYRLVGGQPRPFSEQVFWEEAYSTSGGRGSTLPTDMWIKRPRGQLLKVAKSASLRAAFPEEGELTAEEMEGKVIDAGGVVIDHQPAKPANPAIEPPANTDQTDEPEEAPITEAYIAEFETDVNKMLGEVQTLDALDKLWRTGFNAEIRKIGEVDKKAQHRLIAAFSAKKNDIRLAAQVAEAVIVLEGTKQPQEDATDNEDADEPQHGTDGQPAQPYTPPPPPAAIAAALNTAAVLRLSSRTCRRSMIASSSPSMWYGRANCKSEHKICGVQSWLFCGGREDV